MEVWQIRQVARKLLEIADDIEKYEDLYEGYHININIEKMPEYKLEEIYYDTDMHNKEIFFKAYNHSGK